MKVQDEERKARDERVDKICVTEGSSVDVSFEEGKRGVNWERGYIAVFGFWVVSDRVELGVDEGWIRGVRSFDEALI